MLHQGQQQGQRHLYSSPHPAHCPRGEGAGRPAPERQRPRPPQRQGTTHPEPPPPLSLQRPPLRPPLLGRLLVRWPSPLRRVAGEPGCQYQQHGQQWRRWQQKKCCRFGRHPPPAARRFPSPWRGRSPPHPCLSSTPGRIPSNPPRGQETAELGLPLPLRATGCEPCRLEPNDQVLAARHPVNRLVHVRPRPAVARVEKCIVRGGRQPVGHKPIRPKRRPRVPTVPAG